MNEIRPEGPLRSNCTACWSPLAMPPAEADGSRSYAL